MQYQLIFSILSTFQQHASIPCACGQVWQGTGVTQQVDKMNPSFDKNSSGLYLRFDCQSSFCDKTDRIIFKHSYAVIIFNSRSLLSQTYLLLGLPFRVNG